MSRRSTLDDSGVTRCMTADTATGVIRFVQNLVSTIPPEIRRTQLYFGTQTSRCGTKEACFILQIDGVEISRYSTAFAEALRKNSAM